MVLIFTVPACGDLQSKESSTLCASLDSSYLQTGLSMIKSLCSPPQSLQKLCRFDLLAASARLFIHLLSSLPADCLGSRFTWIHSVFDNFPSMLSFVSKLHCATGICPRDLEDYGCSCRYVAAGNPVDALDV